MIDSPPAEPNSIITQPKQKSVAVQRFESVRDHLEKRKSEFAAVLPPHLKPERLARVALTTISLNKSLMDCDVTSLVAAVMTSAQLGLEPDGILGQAYIVPFTTSYKDEDGKWHKKKVAQLIPGYRGLLTLARNSGDVDEFYAHEVRANDEFDFDIGNNSLRHNYDITQDRGDVIAFYAVAKFKGGGRQMEIMSKTDIEAVRNASPGYRSAMSYVKEGETANTPWVTHFTEMGRKTVIRRLAKYLPVNVHKLRMATSLEDEVERGKYSIINNEGILEEEGGNFIEGEVYDTPTKTDKVRDKLKERQSKAQEVIPTAEIIEVRTGEPIPGQPRAQATTFHQKPQEKRVAEGA